MVSFFKAEREQAGWRFLLFWVLMTNLGFFLGLAVEILILKQAVLYLAVPLAGLGQAYVVNRHISIYLPWAVGTAIFWIIGALIGSQIINAIMPGVGTFSIIRFVFIAAVAGALAGIPQWIFARDWLPIGVWWILLSALAWAVQFPGFVTGIVLMYYITKDKVPMEGRHYELSGEY